MGDRVIVLFRDDGGYSPGIYLHWGGEDAASIIKAASGTIRRGDASYSAARFTGHCCEAFPGHTGVGLLPPPDPEDLPGYSHGDNGIFVVNVETGGVEHIGGYTKEDPFIVEMRTD